MNPCGKIEHDEEGWPLFVIPSRGFFEHRRGLAAVVARRGIFTVRAAGERIHKQMKVNRLRVGVAAAGRDDASD